MHVAFQRGVFVLLKVRRTACRKVRDSNVLGVGPMKQTANKVRAPSVRLSSSCILL